MTGLETWEEGLNHFGCNRRDGVDGVKYSGFIPHSAGAAEAENV